MGTVPDIFDAFPNLTSLNLAGNCLEGAVPVSLGSLTKLTSLNLSNNRFNGFTLTSLSATDVNVSFNALGEQDDNTTLLASLQADYLATQTIAPSNISVVADDNSATISWEAIAFASGEGHYEIGLRKVGASSWSNRATENRGETTLGFEGLESSADYEVQLRSVRINSAEKCFTFSSWTESKLFSALIPLPARAKLSDPTDYALNTATALNLVVFETANSNSYEIQLSTSKDFGVADTETFSNATGEQEIADLMINTRYFWRARGINARGAGLWSSIGQFRTGLSTAAATTTGQVNCVTEGSQIFMWDAIAGASHYRVEIATDANFSNVVKRARALQSLQLTGVNLQANQTYYWRVQGYNDVSAYIGKWSAKSQLNLQPRIQVAGELELCGNGSSTLSLNAADGTSIQWYANGTAIPGATDNSYTAMDAGEYYAILTSEEDGNTCDTYQTEIIFISEVVLMVPAITTSSNQLCEGESTTLSTTASGNYQWFRNGTAIEGATDMSYSTNEAGTYSVEVSANQTCSVTSAGIVVNVTAIPQQQAISVTGSLTLCGEEDATTLSLNLAQGQSIQWYHANGSMAGSTNASLVINQAGTYYAVISNVNCTMQTQSVEVSGTVLPNPVISMSPFVDMQLRLGRPIALYAPESVGIGYRWFKDGVELTGLNSRIILATQNGNYQVEVFDAGTGCSRLSEVLNLMWPAGKEPKGEMSNAMNSGLVGAATDNSGNWISAWPNPTQGSVTVSISLDVIVGEVEMQVLDFLSRPIYTGTMQENGDQLERQIDLSGLRKGLYYVLIRDSKRTYRRTIILK